MTTTTKDTKSTKEEFDELSNRVIDCAIEGHRHVRRQQLKSARNQCLGPPAKRLTEN